MSIITAINNAIANTNAMVKFVKHDDGLHAIYADKTNMWNIHMIDVIAENDNGSITLRRRFDDGAMHIYSFSNEYDAAAWLLGYEQFKDCAHLF